MLQNIENSLKTHPKQRKTAGNALQNCAESSRPKGRRPAGGIPAALNTSAPERRLQRRPVPGAEIMTGASCSYSLRSLFAAAAETADKLFQDIHHSPQGCFWNEFIAAMEEITSR